MNAETAYLFRHALMRDAAYQLQMPGDRAKLHGLAIEIIVQIIGKSEPQLAHVAGELADHARKAITNLTGARARKLELQTCQWDALFAKHAALRYENAAALVHLRHVLDSPSLPAPERSPLLLEAGRIHQLMGAMPDAQACVAQAVDCADNVPERAKAITALARLLAITGRMGEAEVEFRKAIDMARAAGRRDAVCAGELGLASVLAQTGRAGEADVLAGGAVEELAARGGADGASSLGTFANVLWLAGKASHAELAYMRAVQVARDCGALAAECSARGNLANILGTSGRTAESDGEFDRALEIAARAGDVRVCGILRANRATMLFRAGDWQGAEREYIASLAIHRECGNQVFEAVTTTNLASLLTEQGRFSEAKPLFEQGIMLHRAVGNARSEAVAAVNFGSLLENMGEVAAAMRQYETAIDMCHRAKAVAHEGLAIGNLALLELGQGRIERALESLQQSVDLLRGGNDRYLHIAKLCSFAQALLIAGDSQGARRRLSEGAALAQGQSGSQRVLVLHHAPVLARVAISEGDFEKARELVRSMSELARAERNTLLEAECGKIERAISGAHADSSLLWQGYLYEELTSPLRAALGIENA